jgi:hypothetical protein
MEGAIVNEVASVRALVEAGANLNIQDQVGRTNCYSVPSGGILHLASYLPCDCVTHNPFLTAMLSKTARIYGAHVGSGARAHRHSAAAIECGGRQLSA